MKSRFLAMAVAALICFACPAWAQSFSLITLTEAERSAMNLFLSNFTEVGCDEVGSDSNDRALVDFAHDHLWFNDYDAFEYGAYPGNHNCRVSDDRIQSIIDRYFYDARPVDLSQTRFAYDGAYYYHDETGGWLNGGFAQTVSVCPIGGERYFVSFIVFGVGEAWENDALSLSAGQAQAQYGEPSDYGHAIVHASDLSKRSTYQMIHYER